MTVVLAVKVPVAWLASVQLALPVLLKIVAPLLVKVLELVIVVLAREVAPLNVLSPDKVCVVLFTRPGTVAEADCINSVPVAMLAPLAAAPFESMVPTTDAPAPAAPVWSVTKIMFPLASTDRTPEPGFELGVVTRFLICEIWSPDDPACPELMTRLAVVPDTRLATDAPPMLTVPAVLCQLI